MGVDLADTDVALADTGMASAVFEVGTLEVLAGVAMGAGFKPRPLQCNF